MNLVFRTRPCHRGGYMPRRYRARGGFTRRYIDDGGGYAHRRNALPVAA